MKESKMHNLLSDIADQCDKKLHLAFVTTEILYKRLVKGSLKKRFFEDYSHTLTKRNVNFRVTIAVVLKGLEDVFTEDVVDPTNDGVNSWRFTPEKQGCTKDTVNGKTFLKEVYEMSHPNYTGRITVPVLFDKKTKKIVNNESLEIVRMLNTEFNEFSSSKQKSDFDLRPGNKEKEIDELMSWITP